MTHNAEKDAPRTCGCPVGFGGLFRFHRYPCAKAGSVTSPGVDL